MEKQIFIKNIELPTKKYVDDSIPSPIQYSTMPTASESLLGKIVQYIGTTDATYTNGYFYKCVENSGVYSWENIGVQEVQNGDERLLTLYLPINYNNINYSNHTWYSSSYPSLTVFYNKILEYDTNGVTFDAIIRAGSQRLFANLYFKSIQYGQNINFVGQNYWELSEYDVATMSSNASISIRKRSIKYIADTNNNYSSGFLGVQNTVSYTPTGNYNPATKKYVDDSISSAVGDINTILATLTTPSSNEGGN